MLQVLKTLDENSIDTCITDPPYHLTSIVKRFGKENSAPAKYGTDGVFSRASQGFMGQTWDGGDIAFQPDTWREVYRVLKPGAYLLSFGGTRTYHRMVCAVEDAGFIVVDTIVYAHSQGFPKSLNISKNLDKRLGAVREKDNEPVTPEAQLWRNHKSALKPAIELIVIAMKPLYKSYVDNALTYGVAGFNIEGSRIPAESIPINKLENWSGFGQLKQPECEQEINSNGRYPSNLIIDDSDEVRALFPDSKSTGGRIGKKDVSNVNIVPAGNYRAGDPGYGDDGSAARFFYVSKASKAERNAGLDSYVTVKYNCNKSILGGLPWKDVSMVVDQLLKRVILDTEAVNFSIDESGESIMVLCQKDSLSTILMEINKIIESKTLNSLMRLPTNEYIADANCETECGGNLVTCAENTSQSQKNIGILQKKGTLVMDVAKNVILELLSKIKNEKDWKEFNNFHATVKPITLLRHLVSLTKTPTGGTVLDPFMGSGTTGCACVLEDRDFIGIEMSEEYFEIAKKRIEYYEKQPKQMKLI